MEDRTHSFASYFKRCTSSLVVLSLLREKPMYTYELSQELLRRSQGGYTIAILYPIMYRLEEQGYIEISQTLVIDGRTRSYYRVTDEGESYLKHTMAEFEELLRVFRLLTSPEA